MVVWVIGFFEGEINSFDLILIFVAYIALGHLNPFHLLPGDIAASVQPARLEPLLWFFLWFVGVGYSRMAGKLVGLQLFYFFALDSMNTRPFEGRFFDPPRCFLLLITGLDWYLTFTRFWKDVSWCWLLLYFPVRCDVLRRWLLLNCIAFQNLTFELQYYLLSLASPQNTI